MEICAANFPPQDLVTLQGKHLCGSVVNERSHIEGTSEQHGLGAGNEWLQQHLI